MVRAYALLAVRRPELRRMYMKLPYARLYEHSESIASVIVERELNGERIVLPARTRAPENQSIGELDDWLKQSKAQPLAAIKPFRRALRIARLPWPLRRLAWWIGLSWWGRQRARQIGTFGVSVTAGFGAATLFVWSPCTTTLHYGVFERDGTLPMRLTFDHRVLDGASAARTLVEFESILLGDVLRELQSMAQAAA
jgi:hypothetical protein